MFSRKNAKTRKEACSLPPIQTVTFSSSSQLAQQSLHPTHHAPGRIMFSFGEQEKAPAKPAASKKKSRRVSLADRSRNDENAMPPSTPRALRGPTGKGGASLQAHQAFLQVRAGLWSVGSSTDFLGRLSADSLVPTASKVPWEQAAGR